jgi:hypothetical protein
LNRRYLRGTLLSLLAFWLAGCTSVGGNTAPSMNDPQSVALAVRVTVDNLKKMTRYEAPPANGNLPFKVNLQATKARSTGVIAYEIFLAIDYSVGFALARDYDAAFDARGEKLDLESVEKTELGCTQYTCFRRETLSLLLARKDLEQHRSKGLRFKIVGKGHEHVVSLSPAYIQGFLLAVN